MRENRLEYRAECERGPLVLELAGRARRRADEERERPAVGDWVVVESDGSDRGLIVAVLERRGAFARNQVAGAGRDGEVRTEKQVLAANVDLALIVCSLSGARGLSLPRIERYLTLSGQAGAAALVILTKADLYAEPDAAAASVRETFPDTPLLCVNALEPTALEPVRARLCRGVTAVLLGPSGVGKSTILNTLCRREITPVAPVRGKDGRGRHTTTWREIVAIPDGGLVVDTPGMRDVQLWADEADLLDTFPVIRDLAGQCRFRDCTHRHEQGCAVLAAVEDGTLSAKRLESFLVMLDELRDLTDRQSHRERLDDRRWKQHPNRRWDEHH
jgi:ribosome biogenesis GTPase